MDIEWKKRKRKDPGRGIIPESKNPSGNKRISGNRRTSRSRRKTPQKSAWKKWYVLAGIIFTVIAAVLIGYYLNSGREKDISGAAQTGNNGEGDWAVNGMQEEETADTDTALTGDGQGSPSGSRIENQAEKQAVVDSYQNLGIVDVSGYLNVRKAPSTDADIIGRLLQNGACEILGTEGEWYQIHSGEIDGYINSQYVLTGEEARTRALEQVKLMAVITADSLNIRSEPVQDASNVTGAAALNERYEVLGQEEGWIQIRDGYISSEYAQVRYALEEATQLDLKTMAISRYNNLVISKVNNYLNVRSSPENQGDSNVIGKMPGRAAGEILETLDGWYHIRSGSINGYITADTQYTAVGREAADLALQSASLMAIVNTERLNVRTEASTESAIWTQISQEERYPVVQQMDGWVQIELDSTGEGDEIDAAFLSTRDNNVEVRYALAEAIKFSPLEELAGQERSLRSQVVNYAVQFVGNPYVWGGTSLTNGADCSGFVLSVMRHFGVSLPRTSSAQSQTGTTVPSSEMQPGDLVFYANGSGAVNHVAMYIGNGQVVHASSRRTGIKISTWNYRTPRVIKRVL